MAHFTPALFAFLRELADHNERVWFEANRARYDRDVKEPALALITALEAPLADIAPQIRVIAKAQGGSLFRIHRDTRFSADKTPYKTHTGVQLRHAATREDVHGPGLYLHLDPGGCGLGVGMWTPPNPVLSLVRDAIVARPKPWADASAALTTRGWTWMGESLKRVPRGYAVDHPHADDLRRKSYAMWLPIPHEEVCAEAFVERLLARWQDADGLMRFLCEAVDLPW